MSTMPIQVKPIPNKNKNLLNLLFAKKLLRLLMIHGYNGFGIVEEEIASLPYIQLYRIQKRIIKGLKR
jgi:hypothetical protein